MNYTLIMPNGNVMTFFIADMANLYQTIYGGIIVTSDVFKSEEVVA
jgi:hypothetical protein